MIGAVIDDLARGQVTAPTSALHFEKVLKGLAWRADRNTSGTLLVINPDSDTSHRGVWQGDLYR